MVTAQALLLSEIDLVPGVMVECEPKFSYFG